MTKNVTVATVIYVIQNDKILLGYKKRGFGMGKWNGFGGKVEPNETIVEAVNRELEEECGIRAIKPKQVGFIRFEFDKQVEKRILHVHVFVANNYSGKIVESDEMKPKWFNIDEIPYEEMWKDDIYWFPLMLQGKAFKGDFLFGDFNTIKEKKLQEINDENYFMS